LYHLSQKSWSSLDYGEIFRAKFVYYSIAHFYHSLQAPLELEFLYFKKCVN